MKSKVICAIQDQDLQDKGLDKWEELEGKNDAERQELQEAFVFLAQANLERCVSRDGEFDLLTNWVEHLPALHGSTFLADVLSPGGTALCNFWHGRMDELGAAEFVDRLVFLCTLPETLKAKAVKIAVLHALQHIDPSSDKEYFEHCLGALKRLALKCVTINVDVLLWCEAVFKTARATNKHSSLLSFDLTSDKKAKVVEALETKTWKMCDCASAAAILIHLCVSLAGQTSESLSTKCLSLQHILPVRQEGTEWEESWRDDKRKCCLDCLGNFVLLNQANNSKCGNHGFSKTRETCVKSTPLLTREIGENQAWTLTEFEAHQKSILNKSKESFCLD